MSMAGMGVQNDRYRRNFGSGDFGGRQDPNRPILQPQPPMQMPGGAAGTPGDYIGLSGGSLDMRTPPPMSAPDEQGKKGGFADIMDGADGIDFSSIFGSGYTPPSIQLANVTGMPVGGGTQVTDKGITQTAGDATGMYQALIGGQTTLGKTAMDNALQAYLGPLANIFQLLGIKETNKGNLGTTGLQTEAQKYVSDQQRLAAIEAARLNNQADVMGQERLNSLMPGVLGYADKIFGGVNMGGTGSFSAPRLNPQQAINQATSANARQEASGLRQLASGAPGYGSQAARLAQQRAAGDARASADIPADYAQRNQQLALNAANAASQNRGMDMNALATLIRMLG